MKDLYHDIKWFFRNLIKYRKFLINFRPWDSIYSLNIYAETIKDLRENIIKHSQEVEESRNIKTKEMEHLTTIIESVVENDYAERCGYDHNWEFKYYTGKSKYFEVKDTATEEQRIHNNEAIDRANLLREKEWGQLVKLIGTSRKWWY